MKNTKSVLLLLAAFAFMAAACNNQPQPAKQDNQAQPSNAEVKTFIADEEETAALGEEANTNSTIQPAVAPGTPAAEEPKKI